MTFNLKNVVSSAVIAATTATLAQANVDPSIPVEATKAGQQIVANQIAERVEASPEIQHLTSSEKWWQSRANWSAIVGGLTPLLAIAGYNLSPEDQALIAAALGIAGSWLAAYLARRARTATKPLGA